MKNDKLLMAQVATLYYEKNLTQQEIANTMKLSRQTISKLLNEAVTEKIVEIKIHNPEEDKEELARAIRSSFTLSNIHIATVSSDDTYLRQLMTSKTAVDVILPLLSQNKKIAISWGRTIQAFIEELPHKGVSFSHSISATANTSGNIVFPLFGATDRQKSYYLSNELARLFAEKIGARAEYAWFPYVTDNASDYDLFKRTSYYKNMEENWNNIDIAIVGIGNRNALSQFEEAFGPNPEATFDVGDIATHSFTVFGTISKQRAHTLCVSEEALKQAKKVFAIACGNDKTEAIVGALRTGLITDLIVDEYTAKSILEYLSQNNL